MAVQERSQSGRYALFRCEDCEVEWPAIMPAIEAPWPTCSYCGSLACLLWAMVPEIMYKAELLHKAFELLG